jgi:acyl carrier protein
VTPQASFIDDLGADSLAMVELVLAMEERLGISVPEEDTEQIRTVADAITYVQEQQARSAREAS